MSEPMLYPDRPGGRVVPDPLYRPGTGSWRTGWYPVLDASRCVDCLLCWIYCPDLAITTDQARVSGIDLNLCKDCEICVAACPEEALVMVEETGAHADGIAIRT